MTALPPDSSRRNGLSPDVVLAHPSGNQFFRHLARALVHAGRLRELCTSLDWNSGVLAKLLPAGIVAELERRSFSRSIGAPVSSHPWREGARLVAGRLGWSWLTRHETGLLSVDAVYRDFDRWVGRRLTSTGAPGWVYAYEDAAEAAFRRGAESGWRRAYDLPIAYWEHGHQLLVEEADRWPAWEYTLESTRNSPAKLERKARELALADSIICPSAFVARSLPKLHPRQQVVIAPFGSPPPGAPKLPSRSGAALRVLFVGALSQRKGLADLFAAVTQLGRRDVQLVVLGSPVSPIEFYLRQGVDFVYEKPRPHEAVLEVMRTCDVFCLPSIVEGRALVVQEALSQGLPAIVTPNSGAEDAIDEGVSGWVVPIRRPDLLAERLAWCADHRAEVAAMSAEAQRSAARLTWADYGAKVIAALSRTP